MHFGLLHYLKFRTHPSRDALLMAEVPLRHQKYVRMNYQLILAVRSAKKRMIKWLVSKVPI